MKRPSLDQSFTPPAPSSFAPRRSSPLPSAAFSYRPSPALAPVNAIHLPSGDHAGFASVLGPNGTPRLGTRAVSTTQTSLLLFVVRESTTRRPSGAKAERSR